MNADETPGDADSPEVFVRPFGHVADRPVVRRIGDRDLHLGNGPAADPGAHDRRFEYVLSVSRGERGLTTHHRPLVDGDDADWTAFESAVDAARRLVRRDGSVLIHCRAGISRSAAVVAATLAAEESLAFRDALGVVHAARPHAMPHPRLHELAVTYLAARG
ncbi:dual specificity protein phosphatase family protein [Halorussus salilacus]|uniref:protein-tyrosine phosphatase family protein n=1 Tax=Halorussus salilacus TaxID=2953750 RepID=UPI0020A09D86|nr:dual specificity protein phosphatase family protein [Halorussus salilacus]USZ68158.1 dual specificity protein phosphatase family protein [Halorussus salilacus]